MAANIKTYTSNVRAPVADSAGSEAFEIEGRHIEASYAQAGQALGRGIGQVGDAVQDHFEIQDTSQVSAAGAQAFADLSKSLATTAASSDPNEADKTMDQWRSQMEDQINKIGSDVVTKQGEEAAERVRNSLRNEFTTKSMAYQSSLSGTAIKSNLDQTANGLTQAVSNDPTSLPGALAYWRGSMQDQLKSHSYLSAEDIGQIQGHVDAVAKQMGVAAFDTMAQKNPQAAKDALTSGTFAGLFNGDEINSLNRYADEQAKAAVEGQKAAQTQQKEQDTQAFRQTTAQLSASMIQPDGTLRVPPDLPQKIIKASLMPQASPGEIRSVIDMTKAINTQNAKGVKAVTDPATYSMFNQKLLSGQLTDADIYQARADGHLSDHDTSFFISAQKNLAADPARKAALKDFAVFSTGQKAAFVHGSGQISVDPATGQLSMGSSDPVGAQNYANFYRDAQQQYNAAYDRDPKEAAAMLDPKSPSYLGRIAPQYLANKKSADFNTTSAPVAAPVHLQGNQIDTFVSDPANKGKLFIAPDGKTYRVH